MRVNARGQITIPARIRQQAGLLPGTEVAVDFDGGAVRVVNAAPSCGGHLVARLRGRGDLAKSTEQIMALTRKR